MKPPSRTLVLVFSFVTLTSKVQGLGGPPLFAVISAVIDVLETGSETLTALGDGPQPFSNVTEAPLTKPLPPIVT